MADGIEEAEVAFATEINPEATPERPRDSSGRFAARPETMFEPRPVEGDETGDTRDGGEDPRLAANDNQRTANDNEAPAEELDADGKPKPKPEGEDDESPKYEVTVDGERMEVSLDEALKGYIREQTFHQRMGKVAEARHEVEQEAATVVRSRDQYVQRLQFLERVIGELTPPQPDWDKEFAEDPRAAHFKQKAYAEIYNKVAWAQQEQQRTAQEAAQEYDRKSAKYAVEQFQIFVQEANIPDEKTLNERLTRMREYAKFRKFNEREIAETYDNRMLAVLDDATKYHQSLASTPKPVQPGKGKTLAPGVATPIGNATRRSLDEAMTKLAKTGRTDDAAQVFQRLIR